MNVVDSSGWIEYLGGGPNAKFFAEPICDSRHLLVSAISVFEVYRLMRRQRGELAADEAAATLRQAKVIEIDVDLAVSAAELAHGHKLAMADAIILATAREHDAILWTQDVDFNGLAGVKYRAKPK